MDGKYKALYENIRETVISLRYGRRLVINSAGSNFVKINMDDILEIVDYDPIKRVMLVIGPKEPKLQTPVHWLICHAKKEINIIIEIKNSELAESFKEKLPTTKKDDYVGILEQAKDTAEEGSAADVETWRDKIESSGWTDEAINATRATREK